jgi:hypothetical protein
MVFAFTYDAKKEIMLKIPLNDPKVALLNTTNNLIITCQKFKEDYVINDTLLKFLRKYSENNKNIHGRIDDFAEIELKDEEKFKSCNIVER